MLELDDGVMEFEPMVGNTAPNTVAGKNVAKKCFNKFLALTGSNFIEVLDEVALCSPILLAKFGTFLAEHYVTKDDNLLMCDSACQYLSGIFNCIQDRFPANEYYDRSSTAHPWYSDLRLALRKTISLRCQMLGDEIASKSFPIGRELLRKIAIKLLHGNTVDGIY